MDKSLRSLNITDPSILRQFSLFKNLTDKELQEVSQIISEKSYKTNAIVFQESSKGDSMFFIKSGVVKISLQGPKAKGVGERSEHNLESTLAILDAGNFFGEMALIDGSPRSAYATMLEGGVLWEMTRDKFYHLLRTDSNIAFQILVTMAADISERLRATNRMLITLFERSSRAKEEIEEIKSNLISMLSHEMRTPLAVIKASTDVLENIKLDESMGRKFISQIGFQTGRMTRIVNDLLDLCTIQYSGITMMKSMVNIHSVISEVVQNLQSQVEEKELQLEVSIPENLPQIYADETQLNRVFYNLLDNAIKFNKPRGIVDIKVMVKEDYLHTCLSDTGVGIEPENIDEIFELFHQQDNSSTRSVGGIGAGLSIVKYIVEAHNGSIRVESEKGKGSTFIVVLPLTKTEKSFRGDNNAERKNITHR